MMTITVLRTAWKKVRRAEMAGLGYFGIEVWLCPML